MSEVYASFDITFKKKNGKPDNAVAKKVFDWCKQEYEWFLEWGDGPFGLKGNVISTAPAFEGGDGLCIKNTLNGRELGWCEAIFKKFNPEYMEVNVFSDASECTDCMTKKIINAVGKNGSFSETKHMVFDEFDYESDSSPFKDADELNVAYAPGVAYDSCDGFLIYCGRNWEYLELAIKNKKGREENLAIVVDGGGDLPSAVHSGKFILKLPSGDPLLNSAGKPIRSLADLDFENTVEKSEEYAGCKLLGIKLVNEKKPIVLEAWKNSKKKTEKKVAKKEPAKKAPQKEEVAKKDSPKKIVVKNGDELKKS